MTSTMNDNTKNAVQDQVTAVGEKNHNEAQDTKNNGNVKNNRESLPQTYSLVKYSLDQHFHKYISKENGIEVPLYRSTYHTHTAFDILSKMQKTQMLSDVELVTNDGFKVSAHKTILSACSPYFYSMFSDLCQRPANLTSNRLSYGNIIEQNEIVSFREIVLVKHIDYDILKILVNFMYSTEIHITEDNVQPLLAAAKLLEITVVVNTCRDFLLRQLHPSNCLGFREIAFQYDDVDLLAQIDGYIDHFFSEIIKCDEFFMLSAQQLIKLISKDYLTVLSEEIVFECVISWINHNLEKREHYLAQLIEHVRLPLMSLKYLLTSVWKEKLVKASSQSKDYLIEAIKYHFLEESEEFPCQTPCLQPRKSRELPKLLVAIAGKSLNGTRSVKFFDFRTGVWYLMPKLPTDFCHGVITVLGGKIYTVGGCNSTGTPLKNMNVYDSCLNQWSSCTQMQVTRRNLAVAALGNYIYAIGGWNGNSIYSSVEAYDPTTDKWIMIPPMPTARCNSAVCVLNGRLYVVGGIGEKCRKILASVLCYDPQIGKWTDVENLTASRKNAGAGVLNGMLYVVGGKNSNGVMKSVEVFDPKINMWKKVKNMPDRRERVAVAGLGNQLYVVGGYNGVRYLTSANVYSPETDTWKVLPNFMKLERDIAGIAVIDKPHDYI